MEEEEEEENHLVGMRAFPPWLRSLAFTDELLVASLSYLIQQTDRATLYPHIVIHSHCGWIIMAFDLGCDDLRVLWQISLGPRALQQRSAAPRAPVADLVF